MNIFSILLNSSSVMWVVALVCAALCIRFLVYVIVGGTSFILKMLLMIVFGVLAYYCWTKAGILSDSNSIDRFVFDTWHNFQEYIDSIKSYIF